MAKRPGVVTHGTARDLADNAVGYSASGESQFSRDAASTASAIRREHADRERPIRLRNQNTREFLYRTNKRIQKLKIDISIEDSRERKSKLQRDLDIRTALAARLEKEIADECKSPSPKTGPQEVGPQPGEISEAWNGQTVTVLPGEFEADYD